MNRNSCAEHDVVDKLFVEFASIVVVELRKVATWYFVAEKLVVPGHIGLVGLLVPVVWHIVVEILEVVVLLKIAAWFEMAAYMESFVAQVAVVACIAAADS